MSKKVLVAEDSSVIQNLTKKILQMQSYQISSVKNGKQVLDVLQKENFDIILMDINMPIMNGLEMLGKVREKQNLNHIPIFMLTTESDPSKIADAKTKGANGWMVKPFEPHHIYLHPHLVDLLFSLFANSPNVMLQPSQ